MRKPSTTILIAAIVASATPAGAARLLQTAPSAALAADYAAARLAADSAAVAPAKPSADGQAADSVAKTRLNRAEGFNALDYVLERRYLNRGDEFSGPWYSHLYLEAGLGAEHLDAPSDAYSFNTLSTVRVGVGKRFSRLHSARLTLHGGFGFEESSNLLLGKAGARLDYLFNLSSYFDGYNPTRFLELSSVLGIGAQGSQLRRNSAWKLSGEAHVGLQLKFYTGPQGAVNIEPYIGISSDQGDVSTDRNWRKYDVFYGVGLSYVYYLDNTLSRQRRRKLIDARSKADEVVGDSALRSWQQPWFVELAAGPHFMDSPELGFFSTLGHETALSVGKWLSPAIGVRFTTSLRSATFGKSQFSSPRPSYGTTYERTYNKVYAGARVDALINPLGLTKSFAWDKPFGFHLLFGGELGRLVRYDRDELLRCWSVSYSAGAHFWARIADGVQLFVEPRGSWYIYNIPYSDIRTRSIRCTDGGMTVNVGLTVSTYDRKYRRDQGEVRPRGRFTAGLGGGTNLIYRRTAVQGGGMGYNGHAWLEYGFDRISAVRASFEYVSVGTMQSARFYDYNMAYPEDNYLRSTRYGVWHRRLSLGMVSLAYSLNLTEALCGPRGRRLFDVTAYAGPAFVMLYGENASLDGSERLQQGHEARLAAPAGNETEFGAPAGLRLTANVGKGWGVYLAPALYVWKQFNMPGVEVVLTKHVETLNLGVQYNF